MNTSIPKASAKTCACCGNYAGIWQQWHERDTGYGVCHDCIPLHDTYGTKDTEYINQLFGMPGIHRPPHNDFDTEHLPDDNT